MDRITYFKATDKDVQTLVDYRILFALELAGDQPKEKVELLRRQMQEYFLKATSEESCISFLAKYDEQIAGIGSLHVRTLPGNFKNLSGKWGYIMNMYTLPRYRRNGICSGILKLLVEEGIRYGVTAFDLHATKEGEPVYLKNGFEIHPEPTLRRFVH